MIKNLIQQHGTLVSVILVLVIICIALWGYWYIRRQEKNNKLIEHREFIEMIPSLVSTAGVLGTFLGITLGLLFFETKDLGSSIPLLLDGLKTAFFTSLAGMVGSMFLSGKINKMFDEKMGGISDSAEAAGIVVKALSTIQEQEKKQSEIQYNFYNSVQTLVQHINDHIGAVVSNSNAIAVASNNLSKELTTLNETQKSIDSKADSILQSVGNMEETGRNILKQTEGHTNQFGEMLDHTESLVSGQGEISEHVGKFGDRLHAEIVEIEDKMTDTNKLLAEKFKEFSELLKESNTKALVEVMKAVTVEFQKQMNTLINKLIQENFDQLNKSVEQLNTWQKENKEMIQSLTEQYKKMAENFEETSTVLTKVDEDTRHLVSEGGKLHQIVNALNKVIIEDEKFIKISTELQETTHLSKSNFEQFDASTKALNEWVKKQRNFVEGVMVLIQKLEDISKIKDYGEEFWKGTRKQMDEGVGIIKGGTDALNRQVAGLNNQFYARLSTTLTQLDNCIQAFVNKAEKN